MKKVWVFIIFICLCLHSCIEEPNVIVQGMSPIYISWDDITHVKSEAPRPFVNAGKIVSLGNYIFINEANKGIHVIDNSNPSIPVSIAFWVINGNKEFIVKDNICYADNGRHIIVIDISDIQSIKVVELIKNIYNYQILEEFPNNFNGKFECYQPEKGILIDWEVKELTNPLCQR